MIDIGTNGLAYFANNDGILEFDGLRWNKYPLPDGVVVRSVMSTEEGRIYAGGFNKIGYFSPDANGEMVYTSLDELVPDLYKNYGEVWKIYELPYGIIFQSFSQLMIYQDNKINVVKSPTLFHFSFYANSELFINDQKEGLYRLAHDRLVKMPGVEDLKGKLIWSILPKGENLLIATADEGLYEYDGIRLTEWDTPASKLLTASQVFCGLPITNNIYAFGTIQDGVVLCDHNGNVMQHINLERGLQNNTVLSLQLDQYGNLWLGLDNGIDYIEINSPLSFFKYFNNLSAGYAAQVHNGILYLGTNRGVFYHEWNELHNGHVEKKFNIIPGTQGQVWDLKSIDGTLFCGHNSGIYIIRGNQAKQISEIQGGWTFVQPENREDLIICGTYTSLVKIEKENGKWVNATPIKGFKESSRVMANAGKNKLWMTHGYLGVYRLHFNEAFDSITKVEIFNSKNGLPSDIGINVYEIFGEPVFTTNSGIYQYDVRSNGFLPDQRLNDIMKLDDIIELHEDLWGNIWYFTDNDAGVFRLQEDGSYFNLTVPFRELSGRFIKSFQSVYPYDEENVIFGMQDGFVHYAPEFSKNYQLDLKAFIREVELSRQDSVIFKGNADSSNLSYIIPFRHNQLKFAFSANDFENPGDLKFSTYLEGFDDIWSAWNSRSSREFTNLKHGEHTFKVRAKNIFGTESNISTIHFEIGHPWYLTWWAYILYIALLLTIIFLLVVYIRYRMEKSKKLEKIRQNQKFKELEEGLRREALEAEKEVIRLRNEKLNAEMKLKDKELANNTMQMIQKSKSLISIKKELAKIGKYVGDGSVKEHINLLIRKINREIDTENQWKVFEESFESVHEEFLIRLKSKFPDLTPREMKLCAYLRLNISSKEIATLMNISTRGVEISRYRLRKKLNIDHNKNLTEFIMSL